MVLAFTLRHHLQTLHFLALRAQWASTSHHAMNVEPNPAPQASAQRAPSISFPKRENSCWIV